MASTSSAVQSKDYHVFKTKNYSNYVTLKRASLNKDILYSQSKVYSSELGAFAEFSDNSLDAKSKSFYVYTTPSLATYNVDYNICFRDDGTGMSPIELENTICYGRSANKKEGIIGQFGLGLKSAAMRLASNVIIFTKYLDKVSNQIIYSVLLLSKTLANDLDEDAIVVPIPSFNSDFSPLLCQMADAAAAKRKFSDEMDLIYKYSPFKTKYEIVSQFNSITSQTGTLIVCFDLAYNTNTREDIFEINDQNSDILINNYLCNSFKDKPKRVEFEIKTMKKYQEKEIGSLKEAVFKAKSAKNEAQKQVQSLRTQANNQAKSLKYKSLLRKADVDLENKEKELEKKQRDLKTIKKVDFIFGINLENRYSDGLFIYSDGRLIEMYVEPNTKSDLHGVCGVVNLPYNILELHQSKQSFADQSQFKLLIKEMSKNFDEYQCRATKEIIEDLKNNSRTFSSNADILNAFWNICGYPLEKANEMDPFLPLNEIDFEGSKFNCKLHRIKILDKIYFQCDLCLKIREVCKNLQSYDLNSNWKCGESLDGSNSQFDCNRPENIMPISSLRPCRLHTKNIAASKSKKIISGSCNQKKRIQSDDIFSSDEHSDHEQSMNGLTPPLSNESKRRSISYDSSDDSVKAKRPKLSKKPNIILENERLKNENNQLKNEIDQEKKDKEEIIKKYKNFLCQLTDIRCNLEDRNHLKLDQIRKINQLNLEGLVEFNQDQFIERFVQAFERRKKNSN